MKKEFKSYFLSPIAYIVIVIFLVVTGWIFFSPFFLRGRADLRDFFSILPVILSFVIPSVTMKLFSEEYSSGSYEVTLTLPVTALRILMGKFFASLGFLGLMILPTISYPIFISFLGDLDWGPVLTGYLGIFLLSAGFCSIGLLASSLTKNQIVSYIIGLAVCIFLIMVDKILLFIPGFLTGFLQYIGADYHFNNIARGIIDSRDLVYFISLVFLALYGTHMVLRNKR